MQWRPVALVGVLGLGLGWILGGGAQNRSAELSQGRAGTGPRPLGVGPSVDIAPLTQQLRLRLEQQPRAPRPSRNPFVFGSRPAPGSRPATGTPAPPSPGDTTPVEVSTEPEISGPVFRLAGMATTNGPDGPELTAMVHDGQGLLYVKRGDTLPGGFEVVDVQETTVTLRDGAGGERTLRLR